MKIGKKFTSIFSALLLLCTFCFPYASAASDTLPAGLPPNAYCDTTAEDSPTTLSLGDYSYTQIKGTYHWVQKCGGYYYVYAPMTTAYQSTYANILLPTGLDRADGTRNAYISMGIQGSSSHYIDLGICYRGNYWVPYYYEKGSSFVEEPSTYAAPPEAVSAQITVKPVSTTVVQLYVQWKDTSGNNVGTTYNKQISLAAGTLPTANGKIKCQFYRFASLVPKGSDDQGDGSYMTGGVFRYCQLYNGSSYVSWGIGASATVYSCFLVSPSHITLTYSGQNDTFNIRHNG